MTALNLAKQELSRLRVLSILMVLAFGVLIVSLWRMQIGHGMRYENHLESQSIRRIRNPGIRGKIFDRHGACLADNRPNYCIAIYLEELRRSGSRNIANKAWKLIQQLSSIIGQKPQITQLQIARHLYKRKPLPLVAWKHVDQSVLARIAEAGSYLPAVDITVEPYRFYPYGSTACHLLGYVGMARSGKDEDRRFHYYLTDMTGKRSIEKRYNEWLAGKAGGQLVRVDVSGFMYEKIGGRESIPGGDILLAIDLDIQQAAEKVIADTVGSVVVLDSRNGDVLAMANSPGFDLNIFYPSLSSETWATLILDDRKPLLNRAVTGLYAPGSIFKPLVAIAALERGYAKPSQTFECHGYIELGQQRFSCYRGTAHGCVGFQKALEVSCNVFFYQLGLQCGDECIYEIAKNVGIGRKTGIDLDYEPPGLLPNRKWKLKTYGKSWRSGDTCNISIGQGALMVTPLQMAMMTAAIANDGYLYKPRLVIGKRKPGQNDFEKMTPVLLRNLKWSSATMKLVKAGMHDVIHKRSGTGHLARIPGVTMAGKTGTARFGKKSEKHYHGWMIVFAPFENPRYAVAMVLDNAVSGGVSVAPRIHKLMSDIFSYSQSSEAKRVKTLKTNKNLECIL